MTGEQKWKPGDECITPLGRRALLIRKRLDGKWDARYLGPDAAFEGSVILDGATLRQVSQ